MTMQEHIFFLKEKNQPYSHSLKHKLVIKNKDTCIKKLSHHANIK